MQYIDVKWLHSHPEEPIRLVSEIGPDRYETRKIEFWSDGRVGYASEAGASANTCLGDQPVPALEETQMSSSAGRKSTRQHSNYSGIGMSRNA